jgi:hypothetical protein
VGSTPAARTSFHVKRENCWTPRTELTRHASKIASFNDILLRLRFERIAGGAFHVGFTEELQRRLKKRNAGEAPHTARFGP